ncbi:unnamed protein product [Adineta ricciae]|uniref:G-protein coupled receptors family 1 profile domain-containing protein n=2 Tax=Adineta ricciae TaxID=249248 RepID=A0A814CWP2_ADIRI|nr:unnamed protein product [Adineta ricciae]CAF1355791.1 unnamed protein product [Adineta ricciae]
MLSAIMIVKRVFEAFILLFCGSSLLISFITLLFILIRVRPLISDISLLLTCNTYITLVGSTFMTLLITIYSVIGQLIPSLSFNDYACELRSYVNYVFICGFYYSCALQALFRFFRVVFPKIRLLQSRRTIVLALIIQWLIPIFYILAYLLNHDFEYHPDISSCWLSFKNIRALSIAMAFVYGSPLIIMGLIYALIIRYIRHSSHNQEIRQTANKRDLLVVKRIILVVLIGMGIGIPTAFLLIIYMITGQLTELAYHIQALSLTTGLVVESVALGLITSQVQRIFRPERQINPTNILGTVQRRVIDATWERT